MGNKHYYQFFYFINISIDFLNRNECMCAGKDTNYKVNGEVTETQNYNGNLCTKRCPGDNDQICGGFLTLSVYAKESRKK